MKVWNIQDVDGNLLHSGRCKTRRGLIQNLVSAGADLSRADLAEADLSNLDLSGARLEGADLSRADLRGTKLTDALLSNAKLAGARLQGAWLERAHIEASDLTGADLSGARLTYATLRGATLDEADFSKASASSCVLTHVRATEANFSGAYLINADFGCANLLKCDLSGAHLHHRIFGGQEEERAEALSRHLPNRTRNAVVVGCTYDKDTVLADTVPAFRSDARTTKLAKFGLWAATTLGMVYAGAQVPEMLSETALASRFGQGAGFIAVLGGLYLLKEGIGGILEEKVHGALDFVVRQVREAMNEFDREGVNRIHLAVAMAKDRSVEPLRLALTAKTEGARKRGFWAGFKTFTTDIGQVIVCDRRHLAMALGSLSANRQRSYPLSRDIVLLRCDGPAHGQDGTAPCVIGFLKDGRTTACWAVEGGRHATTIYDDHNNFVECRDADGNPADPAALGLPPQAADGLSSVFEFEAALLADHGLGSFSYPRDTHYLTAGRDGTLFVHRMSDRRLDNPHKGSPAMVMPDGSGHVVHNGALKEAWHAPRAP